jgi:hypothetical protein
MQDLGLSMQELEAQTLIELPERQLMTLLSVDAAACITVDIDVRVTLDGGDGDCAAPSNGNGGGGGCP